jgi:L-threonylcarbamoyladenylate synthase
MTGVENNCAACLKAGGVAVIPTDTIYGIVARAEDRDAVERLYAIRKRNPEKACLILIADMEDLARFDVSLNDTDKEALASLWPGPNTIIIPSSNPEWAHIARSTGALAFRLPAKEGLRGLIRTTGPLIAPSANPEGLPPAATIAEARAYFGDDICCYQDAGELRGAPSSLWRLENGTLTSVPRT